MISYTVNVPDDKKSFFEDLIKSLGFETKKENEDFIVPEWHKKILDERLDDYHKNPNDVMDFDLMMQDLRKKYNL